MRIEVSDAASRYICERGGGVFIWFDAVGPSWSRQRVATQPPQRALEFARFDAPEFAVYIPGEMEPPPSIFIGLRPWPFRRLEAAGFGADRDESASGGP
jgi:hypothetical protein